MVPSVQSRKKRRPRKPNRHPVGLTALIYLREALLEERYEECEAIIDVARNFGATFNDVLLLLEDPRRIPLA